MRGTSTAASKRVRQVTACAAVLALMHSSAGAQEASASGGGDSLLSRITVQVPVYTRHIPQDAGFNDRNWGLLVEVGLDPDWSIIGGEFRNSYYRDTAIAVSRYSFFKWDTANIRVDTGVLLGFDLNGGYRDHNGVEPLLGALSIKVTGNRFTDYPLLNGTGVALTVLPGKIVVANLALAFRL